MEDLKIVESSQTPDDLNNYLPNVFLLHKLFIVLALTYALEDVAIVSELHHNAKDTEIAFGQWQTYHREFDGSSKNACL